MRRRLIIAAVAALVVAASGAIIASRTGDGADAPAATGLDTRTFTAGEVDITIEPRRLDADGATFAVALDTHSTELSMDLADARLEVDGVAWPLAGWEGDGPGGHHREGELRFRPAGATRGTARLTLAGFGESVEVDWPAVDAAQGAGTERPR